MRGQKLISPPEVQDCRKIIDYFRGIYWNNPNLIEENQRISTCNQLDLQTLGSQPIMSTNFPDYWFICAHKHL